MCTALIQCIAEAKLPLLPSGKASVLPFLSVSFIVSYGWICPILGMSDWSRKVCVCECWHVCVGELCVSAIFFGSLLEPYGKGRKDPFLIGKGCISF